MAWHPVIKELCGLVQIQGTLILKFGPQTSPVTRFDSKMEPVSSSWEANAVIHWVCSLFHLNCKQEVKYHGFDIERRPPCCETLRQFLRGLLLDANFCCFVASNLLTRYIWLEELSIRTFFFTIVASQIKIYALWLECWVHLGQSLRVALWTATWGIVTWTSQSGLT